LKEWQELRVLNMINQKYHAVLRPVAPGKFNKIIFWKGREFVTRQRKTLQAGDARPT
jgi:hypothetical protein